MSKKVTLIVALLGIVCFFEASQAPKRGRRRWTTGTLRRKKSKDPKQVLLEQMNQAWAGVMSVFNERVNEVSTSLGDIEPDKVEVELNKPDRQSYMRNAQSIFNSAISNYFETYLPSKLKDDHPDLEKDDTVVEQAQEHEKIARDMLVNFNNHFLIALRRSKKKSPAHPPSSSLETRVTQDWNKILQEMDKSAATIAASLSVEIPVVNQDDNSLRAQLASNAVLVQEQFDKIAARIDRFETRWNELFPKFSDEDKKGAVDMFNGFVNTKPQSIDDFKTKIIEYWRNPSAA